MLEKHTIGYERAGIYLNGHRTEDVFRLQGPNTSAPCRTADCTTEFFYDGRERLIEEKRTRAGTTTSTTFTLLPSGSIEKEIRNGAVTDFTYVGDQIHTLTRGGSTQRYWYDDEGNLDCVTVHPGADKNLDCNAPTGEAVSTKLLADYSYDGLNRLAAVKTFKLTTSGGTTTSTQEKSSSYGYDALSRTAKQVEQ